MTKVVLDLYYAKTNLYTKFQVSIIKVWRKKSGKLIFSKWRHIARAKTRQASNLICITSSQKKKEEISLSPMKRAPITTENPKSNATTHKCHQNLVYTTIADRLRTVSWSNNSHSTGVVTPANGIQILQLTTTVV